MKSKFLEMVNAMECDDYTMECKDNKYSITFHDFFGFDEKWNEVEREYSNEKAIDTFLVWLKDNAVSVIDDFYYVYQFDTFSVKIGFDSYDI